MPCISFDLAENSGLPDPRPQLRQDQEMPGCRKFGLWGR